MGRVCRIVIGVAIALSLASSAYAQAATATIRGLVRDSQGRPVPSATVTVIGPGTAVSRVVPTGEDGAFVVANLPPIVVNLTVTASGFGDATHGNIVLEVGQAVTIDVSLAVAGVRERVDVASSATGVDTTRSVVDAVIPSTAIEALPLNGRNFLELAFLVPGNSPAPELRPDQVEQRRGVVGRADRPRRQHHDRRRRQQRRRRRRPAAERHPGVGPGVPDRDQPLHRGVRPLGVLDDQRGHQVGHRPAPRVGGAVPARQRVAGACRRPSIARPAASSPFDRQQLAGSAGGPIVPGEVFWFGAAEYRNQDGAVLVGTRDVPSRTITRGFAPAPLDDFLFSGRLDWRALRSRQHRLPLRRAAGDRHQRQHPRSRDRLGLAAAEERERLQLGRRHVDARRHVHVPERPDGLVQHLRQRDRAGHGRAAAHLPEHPGRHLVPRPAGHDAEPLPARRQRDAGPRVAHGAGRRRVAAHRRALRPRRLPGRPARDGAGLRELRPQRRRPRRRQRPALRGDAAQRQAGPGAGHPGRRQQLLRVLRPGRLAHPARPHAEPRPALGDRHRRQEHQPLRRDQPDRAAVPAGRAEARQQQLRRRASASTGRPATAGSASTAATASTTTASRCRSSRSSAASTGARCRSR